MSDRAPLPPSAAEQPRRFPRTLLLGLLSILILCMAGLLAHLRSEEKRVALRGWEARLSALADARKAAVEEWLSERRADVEVLAWDADLVNLCVEKACPKGADLSRPQSHLDNLARFGGFLGAHLFTPSGLPLLSAASGFAPSEEAASKAREAASGRRFTLHDVHRDRSGERLFLGFLAPVFHREGDGPMSAGAPVVGVVALYVDPETALFPVVAGRGQTTPGVDVYLVRKQGAGVRLLSQPRGVEGQQWQGMRLAVGHESLEQAALAPNTAAGEFKDFRGRRVLAAVRWLPDAGWGLVAKMDFDAALEDWRGEARHELAVAGLAVLCLCLLGAVLWRAWSVRKYRALVASLRDREERLQALALGTDDVVFFKDCEGRYVLVNPAAERMLGAPAAKALGKRARDFLPADVSHLLADHDAEVLATGRSFQGEEEIPVAGQVRTFLAARVPLRNGSGEVQGVAGVLRDITERKQSEETLANRARRLAALYRLSEVLAQAHEPEEVLAAALDGAVDALGFDAACVALCNQGRLFLAARRNTGPELDRIFARAAEGGGILARVQRSGQAEFAANYASAPGALPEAASALGDASAAFVPLQAEGEVLGVLSALCREGGHAFDDEERSAVEALGHMVGGALARARSQRALAEEASERRRAEVRLRQLHESTAGLTGHRLFAEVARVLCEDLGARWLEVVIVGTDGVGTPLAAFEDAGEREAGPFRLEGTPWEEVVKGGRSITHGRDAWRLFPASEAFQRHRAEFCLGSPLLDSRGHLVGVLCAYGDVPAAFGAAETDLLELYARRVVGEVERAQTEERLAEARRALETVIQNLPGAVYRTATGSERAVEYVSPGCEPLTGHPPQAFGAGGLTLGDLSIPEDRPRLTREIENALAAGAPYELEYRIHDRAGAIRWVFDVGRPVALVDGTRVLEGVLLDYTERRTLEAQLTHSQRMEALGRLAGGVAHDFNNLLTAISGYAELLSSRLSEEDRSGRAVVEIVKAADRAADLTRQLLAFSRRQTVEPKVLHFNEGVESTIRMLGRLLGEDVTLSLTLGADVGAVRADPGQLEQVVLNLCVNARDAMPGGGRLTVSTGVESVDPGRARQGVGPAAGEYAVLEVDDTGVGMPTEVREHIFEPFFTTKEPGKGTGLGLATVYGVVSQAGGYVTVASEVGKGTTFRVLWPLHRGADAATEGPVAPGPLPGEGRRVLLAEDEAAVRELTAEYLSELGYAVDVASDGEEALAMADAAAALDVLVTDVVMPGMSGGDLARAVRRKRPLLPTVYMSGHTGDVLLERGGGGPKTSFLQKPFRLSDLARAVEAALAG